MAKPEPVNPIKTARQRAGMTQLEAAQRAGWKQPAWCRFENNRDANYAIETYKTAARVLGCTIDELVN